ncbi:MAG: hypothetical protein ACFE8B_09685 [Candidatus Hermodarchaeota archaeon]
MKYRVIRRSRFTAYLCIASFILITTSYPFSFLISKLAPIVFIIVPCLLSLLFLPLSIYFAFIEKKFHPRRFYSDWGPPPNAKELPIIFGIFIIIITPLITFVTPIVIHFDKLDVIIVVIIDILWILSASSAIVGGILYDDEKIIIIGKRT